MNVPAQGEAGGRGPHFRIIDASSSRRIVAVEDGGPTPFVTKKHAPMQITAKTRTVKRTGATKTVLKLVEIS